MKKWFVKNKAADFEKISKENDISEVVARLIVNRGITKDKDVDEYVRPTIEKLHNPHLMKEIDKAAQIITEKIKSGVKIRIVGDYDVDGIISTYILLEALERCMAKVDYEIPDRINDGYGINVNIIDEAYNDGVDTILTCDNGISAIEQIKHGKALGMTVVVTDHHDLLFEEDDNGNKTQLLPEADAVVNPHQNGCEYPYKNLCGAAVAYKFIKVLYENMGYENEADDFLEYVAIATVCDVMELKGENRIIVKNSLDKILNTSNLGLANLVKVNNLNKISAYHLGFVIGPCLNATGRLLTAKKAIELLRSKSSAEAYNLALELKELNESRKKMTTDNLELAIEMIDNSELKDDKVLVVLLNECHESLAGIIAGRLRDKYYRPVIVLTPAKEGVKGSARSIEQYNMFEELVKCKEYLEKFGGHPMAAGLSLKEENIEKLRDALNTKTSLTDDDLIPKISIDVVLPLGYITEELIDEIGLIEPCGKGNEKPLFAERNLMINSAKVLGKNTNVLKLSVTNQYNRTMEAIYFGDIGEFDRYVEGKFGNEQLNRMYSGLDNDVRLSVIYYPEVNEFNGRKTLQIRISEYQ